MKVGTFVFYNGKQWCVTATSEKSVRLERGFGPTYSVIVVPYDFLFL